MATVRLTSEATEQYERLTKTIHARIQRILKASQGGHLSAAPDLCEAISLVGTGFEPAITVFVFA